MPKTKIIAGPYLTDVLAQPEAVRATLDSLRDTGARASLGRFLAGVSADRIVLTGMGSSFHALHPILLRLVAAGRTAFMVETSELVYFQRRVLGPGSLVVVASQSGRSAETVRLLNLIPNGLPVIGVTNTPDSPLARRAGAVVLTAAGEEFSVSCKTYVATLAALRWLAELLLGRNPSPVLRELSQVPLAMDRYLKAWRRHATSLRATLAGASGLFLVGRGASLAAAGVGALITKESAHFHAEGMSAAAFRHGPLEMVSGSTAVAVFEGRGPVARLGRALVADVSKAGGRSFLVGESGRGAFRLPAVSASSSSLLEILPVQMISLALASLAGREAGRFERAAKVTTTE